MCFGAGRDPDSVERQEKRQLQHESKTTFSGMATQPEDKYLMEEISANIRAWSQRYGSFTEATPGGEIGEMLDLGHRERGSMWQKVRIAQNVVGKIPIDARGMPKSPQNGSNRCTTSLNSGPSRRCHLQRKSSSRMSIEEAEVPRWIVHPSGDTKILWDLWVSTCVVYLTMSMPYALGYEAEASWNRARVRYVVDWLVDLVFLIDIAVTFRTAYISDEGVLITEGRKLAVNYVFKGPGFLVDFLSVCSRSSIFLSSGEDSSVVENARLLRMVRLTKLFKLTRILKLKRKSNKANVEEQIFSSLNRSDSSRHTAISFHFRNTKLLHPAQTAPMMCLSVNNLTARPVSRQQDTNAILESTRCLVPVRQAWAFAAHPAVASACWMLVVLLAIAHMLACIWHGLTVVRQEAATESATGDNAEHRTNKYGVQHWVNANGLWHTTARKRYIVALYWAFQTMTTVGYGDVSVSNNLEKIFAIFVMITGGICFGYIIGNVTSMLENLNMVAALRDQKMDTVKEYVFDRHYPPLMAVKIKQHFRYTYAKLGVFFDDADICDELPVALRVDLLHEQQRHLVAASSLLSHDGGSGPFFVAIVTSLVPCNCNFGDFLFFQSDIATHAYLVEAGAVKFVVNADDDADADAVESTELTTPGSDAADVNDDAIERKSKMKAGVTCGVYSTGHVVGIEGLLLTYLHVYSAYCYTKTHLYTISKEDLVEAFDAHAPGVRLWLEQEAAAIVSLMMERKAKLTSSRDGILCHDKKAKQRDIKAPITTASSNIDDSRNKDGAPPEEEDSLTTQHSTIREQLIKLLRRLKVAFEVQRYQVFPEGGVHPNVGGKGDAASPADLWAKHGLFHPELEKKVAWDVFVSVLIVFSVLGNTYIFAFGLRSKHFCGIGALRDPWLILFVLIDLSFLVDMLATFNTAVLRETAVPVAVTSSSVESAATTTTSCERCTRTRRYHGSCEIQRRDGQTDHLRVDVRDGSSSKSNWPHSHSDVKNDTSALSPSIVTSRRQIAILYANSGWLAVDFLSSVPIDKFAGCAKGGSGQSGIFSLLKVLRALRLVRLAKMHQKSKKLVVFAENLEDRTGVNPAWFKLIKPLFVMFVVAHALTCLFFYAGRKRDEPGAWLDAIADDGFAFRQRTIRHDDRPTQYLTAMYWSFATMTTVGYGDYSPSLDNTSGLAVGILSNVLGTMIFAYVIGILVSLITNLDPSLRLRRAEKLYLRHYLAEIRRAPDNLLTKVSRAQTHVLDMNGVFDDADFLARLPPYLRGSCLVFVYREFLPYAPFLGSLERDHVNCLSLLLPRLKPANYLLGQLVNSPQINARELNFVHVGFCALTTRPRPATSNRSGRHGNRNGVNVSSGMAQGSKPSWGEELYGPQSVFGQATVCIPSDEPFKLRCRVVCASACCHVFLLSKESLDELRRHYEPLVADIENRLYDDALISQWIKLGE